MKGIPLLLGCFLVLLPGILTAADFDFYGIRFGMAREAVEKVFKIDGTREGHEAENPGHYINKLSFGFDHRNRLFYIEAYYLWDSAEHNFALALALKEKFEDPVKRTYKNIEIKMDTYKEVSGQKTLDYVVMKLTSKRLRSEYIDYLRADILKQMK